MVSSTKKTHRRDTNWNIDESGIKHHNPNPDMQFTGVLLFVYWLQLPKTIILLLC